MGLKNDAVSNVNILGNASFEHNTKIKSESSLTQSKHAVSKSEISV